MIQELWLAFGEGNCMGQRAYQCVSTSLSSFTVGVYLVSGSVRKLQDPKKCKNMGKYDAMIARNACSTSRLHQGQDTQADSSTLNWIILLIPRM